MDNEDIAPLDEEARPGETPQEWSNRMDDQEVEVADAKPSTRLKRPQRVDEWWDPHLGSL